MSPDEPIESPESPVEAYTDERLRQDAQELWRVLRPQLLRKIRAMRDSIEAEKGILPESWPLIRKDRDTLTDTIHDDLL